MKHLEQSSPDPRLLPLEGPDHVTGAKIKSNRAGKPAQLTESLSSMCKTRIPSSTLYKLSMVVCAYNPSAPETEAGGSSV